MIQCSKLVLQKKQFPAPNAEALERKKSRVHSNFSEVLEDYICVRLPEDITQENSDEDRLQVFSENLETFTRYSTWRELSSLTYGDPSSACSIVSSIEFDREGEVFAVAGVTKKIKVT